MFNDAIVIAAIIGGIFNLVGTAMTAWRAKQAREGAHDALDLAMANREILNRVERNGEEVKVLMDRNHDVLVAIHGFEEYQHTRNHDMMNALTGIRGRLDVALQKQGEREDRMIELLEIIAQQG